MFRKLWAGDVNSNAGKELDSLISTTRSSQLIDTPTHLFSGRSSCNGLIYCNKSEIVNECGIDHSLLQTCYHNLIFAKSLPASYVPSHQI